jgi:tRNA pseudouridine38-40 synthase
MPRYLICVSYDGTEFSGWQTQPDTRTVQDVMERCFAEICRKRVGITGAGRTDAGVHALRQYAHFDLDTTMTARQIVNALNSKLPADLSVLDCRHIPDDFSARYDAIARIYHYHLSLMYSPVRRLYSAWLPRFKIIPARISQCFPYFLGEHDFSAFARHNPDLNHYRCVIHELELRVDNQELVIEIKANRFLHNMVRRIVGTCLRISHTGKDPAIITSLISEQNPQNNLIYTAPAEGLFLADVIYPSHIF